MNRSTWVAILFSIAHIHAFAANIRDLDAGDVMYMQGIFSDELVQVIRIDYGNNRVKVRRSEDGTTKWVNPSTLITREASTGNDVARGAIAIAGVVCLLDPQACQQASRSSSGSGSSSSSSREQFSSNTSSSSSSAGYKFKFTNKCRYEIQLALRYLKTNGEWTTVGWWSINANKYRYLKYKDGSYALSNNSTFYYFAETPSHNLVWRGNYPDKVNGRAVEMVKATDDDGDSEVELTCD